ncbi:MAG: hypothetical protein AAFX56_04065 [Pseudomonadota bacterium]
MAKIEPGNNVVRGRVLNQETGRGIPNLLIVLYDLDKEKWKRLQASYDVSAYTPGDSIGPNVPRPESDDDDIHPMPVDLTTAPPENFTFFQALLADARAWIDFPGDRLGSVLTNPGGDFSLSFQDAAFRIGDKERRPDLVLFVLGPDRDQGVGVIDRLLHYAYVPRENAGRLESYIISISQHNLDQKNAGVLPVAGPLLGDYFDRLRSAAGRDRRDTRRRALARVPFWFTPSVLNANPRYVPATAPAEQVERVVHATIANGVAAVAAASVQAPVVRLTADDLARFPVSTTVSACDVLAQKGLGVELVRIKDLLSEARAERERRALATSGSADTGGEAGGEGETAGTPLVPPTEGMDYITSRVLGQVSELPQTGQDSGGGIIDDLQTIKDRINELEMSSGPANVTAFRDFHSLQMAFKDVWTAAFDSALESDVQELYETVNKINEEYGEVFPRLDDVADISEYEDYVASISADLADEDESYVVIPENVASAYPTMTLEQWNRFSPAGRNRIMRGVNDIDADDIRSPQDRRWEYDLLLQNVMANPSYQSSIGRLKRLMSGISEKLSTPYSFKYYKQYSVNYGILVNYRQEWRPQNYQVGRLVSTLPLAPGEARELKVSHNVKRTRAEKEMRKALVENSYESTSTIRSELDVIAKLSTDSNFKLSAQGSFNLGIGSISSTSEFSHNQKTESNRQHKQIAEATRKASEKVRQEREVSVEASSEIASSSEATQKIHNPNNEVTVTYLMYELERRYRVSQKLNKVTPVIMVALDMPSPHELTEAWILEHAWILRRVLLDDAFDDAIGFLENGRQAEAVDIAVKRAVYERERESLSRVETDLDAVIADRTLIREEVINLQEDKDRFEAGEDDAGDKVKDFFLSGGWSLFGGRSGPDQAELYEAGIKAAESRLKYIDQQVQDLSSRQRAAKREAREAGRQFTDALKQQAQKDTVVKQFQMHLRQNIFHYMHAIWEMKHPDELFFQLAEQEVYHVGAGTVSCTLTPVEPGSLTEIPGIVRDGEPYALNCGPPVPPDFSDPAALRKPLGSIAHVDQLLGFKGNYAIFPLKDCSHLTDHMMSEFVDDYLGVKDPANELGVTADELLEYSKEVWNTDLLTDDEKAALGDLVVRTLSSPTYNTQEIVLPTGQIYMEALKGEQALLEDFKLAHRGMDVLKVQEEIRGDRIDNLRRAGRLIGEDPNFEDPEVDKKVLVTGSDGTIVTS